VIRGMFKAQVNCERPTTLPVSKREYVFVARNVVIGLILYSPPLYNVQVQSV